MRFLQVARRAPAFLLVLYPVLSGAQSNPIATTVRTLKSVPLPDNDATAVPPAVRADLLKLKHQLCDLIGVVVNKPENRDAPPGTMRSAIIHSLSSMGVTLTPQLAPEVSPKPKSSCYSTATYGCIEDITVSRPPGFANLIAAETTLNIPCGVDSSLYIFRHEKNGWQLVLSQEASNYAQISGAWMDLKYAISPVDSNGAQFVVVANINPWCSSTWQSLRYSVYSLGQNIAQAKNFFHQEDFAKIDMPETYKLHAFRDGFQVTYAGFQGLDPGITVRTHIERFVVSKNRIRRIAPIGLIPQDFVDEWDSIPWHDSLQWTRSGNLDSVRKWHQQLSALTSGKLDYALYFDFVQPCRLTPSPTDWQIGLAIDNVGKGPSKFPPEIFFTVVRENGAFYLTDIATERPAGCPGSTPPFEGMALASN